MEAMESDPLNWMIKNFLKAMLLSFPRLVVSQKETLETRDLCLLVL